MSDAVNENAALVLAPRRSPVELLEYAGLETPVARRESERLIGRLVVMLAERYGLDPALKHVEVIPARGGLQVYITADGWNYVAGPELDSLTYPDLSRSQDQRGGYWSATCHVGRVGRTGPFEGRAACRDAENKEDPEAMAMTRARRRALRGAFQDLLQVRAEYAAVYYDDPEPGPEPVAVFEIPDPQVSEPQLQSLTAPSSVPKTAPRRTSGGSQTAAHQAVANLDDDAKAAFLLAHNVTYEQSWPAQVVDDALALPF